MDQSHRRIYNWRLLGECVAAGVFCAGWAVLVCTTLLPSLASAGTIRNWGLHPPPSGLLDRESLLPLGGLAIGSAGVVLGPLLVLAANRPWASLLFGLGCPWLMMAGGALLLTVSPGPWYQGIVSSLGFLSGALTEWLLCAGSFYFLRRVRVFRAPPVL